MKNRAATGRTPTGLIVRAGISLLALLLAPAAFASPPAAPVVTVGAGLKQLQFDWNYVPRANRYEVWFRSSPGAAWAKFAETSSRRPRATVNISAHQLHWIDARYAIKACNPSGCTSSSEISVSHLMLDSVGFFKVSTPHTAGPSDLGEDVDMSEDGNTIAAGARIEGTGGVVVFRKSSSGWAEEAQLVPSVANQVLGTSVELSVAISGDGNVIALGVPHEVRPDLDPGEQPAFGAVYLFRRTSAGWIEEQRFAYANSEAEDAFGRYVDLDESGTLLAAWRRFGDGAPGSAWSSQGKVELFRRTSAGWARITTIPVINDSCSVMGLSGDGRTLVRSCSDHVEVFTAPDWQRVARLPSELTGVTNGAKPRSVAISHDGRGFAVRSVTLDDDGVAYRAWVNVFRLQESGWVREISLAPGDWTDPGPIEDPSRGYALGLSMSRDGQFLAVGNKEDGAIGAGVQYPPISGYQSGRGAVYVYERKPTGWRLRQFIKPNPNPELQPLFGVSVAFARNGKDLAIGAPWDASNARGIDGDQSDASARFRGAVWLY